MADEANPFQAKKFSTTSGNTPTAPAPATQPAQQPVQQQPTPKSTIPPATQAQTTSITPTQLQFPAPVISQIQQPPQLPSEPKPKKKHSWWFWVLVVIGGLIVSGILAYFFLNSF